ncbi:MAG: DUF2171 domain-containing protein [Sphingomonas fennica]
MGYDRDDYRDRDRYGSGRGYGGDDRWNSPRGGGYGQGGYGQRGGGYGQGGYGRDAGYGRGSGGDYRQRDYGRNPQGYDYEDRGFLDRAGDEVRSWFGDEEAQRRREADDRANGNYEDGSRYADSYGYGSFSGGGGYGGGGGSRRYGSDYGAGRGAGATSTWGLGANGDHDGWGRDPNYRSWRDRQMAEFDRDYQEYRTENQGRFDSEFGSWRQTRQTQRGSLTQVKEHQEVVGSDGQHVGTVDKVRGDRIILTKNDSDAGGHHHSIPSSWITTVDDKVTISKTADQAKQHWRDEERDSGASNGWQSQDRTRTRSVS